MVIYVLSFGPLRTGQLQRSIPGISKKMLTQTLRELEADQLLSSFFDLSSLSIIELTAQDTG